MVAVGWWGQESGCAPQPGPLESQFSCLGFPAPLFLRELVDDTVVLGQSVTLACQVLAQPAAQATWSKGERLGCAGDGISCDRT